MKSLLDSDEFKQVIELPDNRKLVLIDRLGMMQKYGAENCARNVYLVDSRGLQLWQISSNFDSFGDPFTSINLLDSKVTAYRWDGASYTVNLENGFSIPSTLTK